MKLKTISFGGMLTVSAAFFLFGATSCKKSNNNNNAAGIGATISGQAYQSTVTNASIDPTNYSFILIMGLQVKDSSSLELYIPDTLKVNEPCNLATDGYLTYAKGSNFFDSNPMNDGHGTLTLTSWDTVGHKVAGTFTGVLYSETAPSGTDSLVVTNGHFNTSYTLLP